MSAPATAGFATLDITPGWPVLQGGFGQRTTPSTGVLDPVVATAVHLTSGGERLLIVAADVIAIPQQLSAPVIAALASATGLEERQICLCASHTHSAPLPFGPPGAPGVERYHQFLRGALVEVGVAAVERSEPCRLAVGTGTVDVLWNRRTRGVPNDVDPRVPVVAVASIDGGLLGVLFAVGCHPVTLGWDNLLISADFPGEARRRIAEELDVAHVVFFNGTEGNVVPATSPDRDALDPRGYCGGTVEDLRTIGGAVADEVVRVVRSLTPSPSFSLGSARRDVLIPSRNAAFDQQAARLRLAAADEVLEEALGADFRERAAGFLWALVSEHVVRHDCDEDEMRRLMIACCQHLGLTARVAYGEDLPPTTVPVQVVHVEGLDVLALPGEPLVEVGRAWAERSGASLPFVMGLANAHLRYLPMPEHFARPDAAVQYDTVTAGLEPAAMDAVLDAAAELLVLARP
jgi:neutral ceramidase